MQSIGEVNFFFEVETNVLPAFFELSLEKSILQNLSLDTQKGRYTFSFKVRFLQAVEFLPPLFPYPPKCEEIKFSHALPFIVDPPIFLQG